MNILKTIKRLWYRWRNSDPVHKCPVYKNEGCVHVDGIFCPFPDCDIVHKYLGHKFVGCAYCQYNQECCSRNYGLGCLTENLIILANSFKSCKNWKELERNFIHKTLIYMKYKKKPVVVEAEQLSATNFDIICDFLGYTPEQYVNPMFDFDGHGNTRDHYLGVYIETLEGKMLANLGDMIIKGVNGEFYPCKPDIFAKTYERVEE